MIPVEESIAEWRKDPEYVRAYDALKDEFSLAVAMTEACEHAEGRLGRVRTHVLKVRDRRKREK
jgi:hypothetical protein